MKWVRRAETDEFTTLSSLKLGLSSSQGLALLYSTGNDAQASTTFNSSGPCKRKGISGYNLIYPILLSISVLYL